VFRNHRSSFLLIVLLSGCATTSAPTRTFAVEPDSSLHGPRLSDAEPELAPSWLAPRPDSAGHGGSAGQWEATLGGSGASDKKVENGSAGLAGSLGYYLSDHFALTARQTLAWVDGPAAGSDTNASTVLAADINFGSGAFRPILGAVVGYVYGDTVHETWVGGPEAGFKIYVKDDVFIQLLAEYQFFFEKSEDVNDAFKDGSLVYSLGFGINF
jgi:hypothetical protein